MRFRLSLTKGFSLVELVMAIVVVGVVFVGVIRTSAYFLSSSIDPITRVQGAYIAEMFLAEIQTKIFTSEFIRNSGQPLDPCPPVPGTGTRQDFTHLCHFRDFNQVGIEDQQASDIPGLEDYRVDVSLATSRIGPGGNRVGRRDTVLVTVTVTGPNNQSVQVSMFRTDIPVEPG